MHRKKERKVRLRIADHFFHRDMEDKLIIIKMIKSEKS